MEERSDIGLSVEEIDPRRSLSTEGAYRSFGMGILDVGYMELPVVRLERCEQNADVA